MTTHPRSDWTKARPSVSSPMRADDVLGVVIHWPASPPVTDVPKALEGWRVFHTRDKGWADIAYNLAIDQRGERWELRGLRTRSAANGTAELNRAYVAILAVLGIGEKPTEAMLAGIRLAIRDVRAEYPGARVIRPHSAVRPGGTSCPGPELSRLLKLGQLDPDKHPAVPTKAPAKAPSRPAPPAFPLAKGKAYGRSSTAVRAVKTWQGRMRARGWNIAADGVFGEQTERVVRAFQAEKHLGVDGLIGPKTWAAAWLSSVT